MHPIDAPASAERKPNDGFRIRDGSINGCISGCLNFAEAYSSTAAAVDEYVFSSGKLSKEDVKRLIAELLNFRVRFNKYGRKWLRL